MLPWVRESFLSLDIKPPVSKGEDICRKKIKIYSSRRWERVRVIKFIMCMYTHTQEHMHIWTYLIKNVIYVLSMEYANIISWHKKYMMD